MTDGCGYDPEWWKIPKAASIARKRRATTSRATAKPGDAFLIVTEGQVTEPVYFNCLLKDLRLHTVHVKVIPGHTPDPLRVIDTAVEEVKAHQKKYKNGLLAQDEPSKFDHVWVVIDTDVAVRTGCWNDVKQLAATQKVKLAHATPCSNTGCFCICRTRPVEIWWMAMPPSVRWKRSWAGTIRQTKKLLVTSCRYS